MPYNKLIFWKVLFVAAIGLAIVTTLYVPDWQRGSDHDYSPAVKGGLLAICAALMVLITLIPNSLSEIKREKLFDVICCGIGAVATVAAGWFILEDEPARNPTFYLAYTVGVSIGLMAMFVIWSLVLDLIRLVRDWVKTRWSKAG